MDHVEIYENQTGWRWRFIDGKSGSVTDHGTFTRYSDALRNAARECGGNLRVTDTDPDRYWVL